MGESSPSPGGTGTPVLRRLAAEGVRLLPVHDWQHVLVGRLCAVGPLRCLEKPDETGVMAWAQTIRIQDHTGELDVVLWNGAATRYARALRSTPLGTCVAVAGARLSEWNGVPRANINAWRAPEAGDGAWLAPGKDGGSIVQLLLPPALEATGYLAPRLAPQWAYLCRTRPDELGLDGEEEGEQALVSQEGGAQGARARAGSKRSREQTRAGAGRLAAAAVLQVAARLPTPALRFASINEARASRTGACIDFAGVVLRAGAPESVAVGVPPVGVAVGLGAEGEDPAADRQAASATLVHQFAESSLLLGHRSSSSSSSAIGSFRAGRAGALGSDSAAVAGTQAFDAAEAGAARERGSPAAAGAAAEAGASWSEDLGAQGPFVTVQRVLVAQTRHMAPVEMVVDLACLQAGERGDGRVSIQAGDAICATRVEVLVMGSTPGAGGQGARGDSRRAIVVTGPLSQVLCSPRRLLETEGYSGDSRSDAWPNVCPRSMSAHVLPLMQPEARKDPRLTTERLWCALEALHAASLASPFALQGWDRARSSDGGDSPGVIPAVRGALAGPCAARLWAAQLRRKEWPGAGDAAVKPSARRCARLCLAWLFSEVTRARELHDLMGEDSGRVVAAAAGSAEDGEVGNGKRARRQEEGGAARGSGEATPLPAQSKDLMAGVQPADAAVVHADHPRVLAGARAAEAGLALALSPTSSTSGALMQQLLDVPAVPAHALPELGVRDTEVARVLAQ